jgi:hypothetical protein
MMLVTYIDVVDAEGVCTRTYRFVDAGIFTALSMTKVVAAEAPLITTKLWFAYPSDWK